VFTGRIAAELFYKESLSLDPVPKDDDMIKNRRLKISSDKLLVAFLLLTSTVFSQVPSASDVGCRYERLFYGKDSVDVLIYSKKGDEAKQKPLFFFCQGSLPQPLIKYTPDGAINVFPFDPEVLATDYHLIIAGKPGVPLVASMDELTRNYSYEDAQGRIPVKYQQNNYLEYYVKRNLAIIKQLQKNSWASSGELIVAGHSEGSTIAVNMAAASKKVTQLIYSGGNPFGRIASIVQEARSKDPDGERVSGTFDYWEEVVANKDLDTSEFSDPHKTTYSFSQPSVPLFEKLTIPVYITYGSRDWCAPYVDFLQLELINRRKSNVDFNCYIGCEHNFFPLKDDGSVNYDEFNWDKVAADWNTWLKGN